jgi:hypothetical protein
MRTAIFPLNPPKQTSPSELIRLIYFGPDDRFRIPILKNAGYTVEQCGSVCQLRDALSDAYPRAEAVAIVERERIDPRGAVFLTRVSSAAALILFQSIEHTYDESEFDFVVPALAKANEWLGSIGALVEQRRSCHTRDTTPSIWQPIERIHRISSAAAPGYLRRGPLGEGRPDGRGQ